MLLEPEAGAGLWPVVKATTGWIESNEDSVKVLAEDWRGAGTEFTKAGGHNVEPVRQAWADPTGGTYATNVATDLSRTTDQGSGMAALAQRVDAFAQTVVDTKTSIRETIALNDPIYGLIGAIPLVGGAAQGLFAAQVAQIVNTTIDNAAAGVSGQAPIQVPPPLPLPNPPAGVAPKDWWAGLSPALRERYLTERPDLLAKMNGLPTEVRDDANRILLDREIARLDQAIADQRGPGAGVAAHGLEERRDSLLRLRDALNTTDPQGNQQYYLLGFDNAGDGRAIVARGNPDFASNVATLVPGADNDITSFADPQAEGKQNLLQRIDALHGSAGGSTAVIGWLDYDSPDYLRAFGTANADPARDDLVQFQQGLRDSHAGAAPSRNTIVGHSYGSLVAGGAARDGFGEFATNAGSRPVVDNFVTVGSLGTGAQTAAELKVPNVWVTEHDDDWLADLGTHGRDPDHPDFRAQVFDSTPNAGVTLPGGAHSGAFDDVAGNTGLTNLGNIISGRPTVVD